MPRAVSPESWQQVSNLGIQPSCSASPADNLNPDQHTASELGNLSRPSHSIIDDQHAIQGLVYDQRRHSGSCGAESGDLKLKLERIGSASSGGRNPQFGGIDSDGSHLDCDCPICQAEADGEFGPAFLCFDGHHLELEDEFAFSLCETREEWERQQEDYRKFSVEMDRKARKRAAGGADDGDAFVGSAWQTSYVNWEALAGDGASPQEVLWALAFPLAELVSDLQSRSDGAEFFKSLNGAYADLRASQDAVARNSAAEQFRESLERVTGNFPELTPKCADLQSRLDEVLRRLSASGSHR
jgi:hypothetical protein